MPLPPTERLSPSRTFVAKPSLELPLSLIIFSATSFPKEPSNLFSANAFSLKTILSPFFPYT
jgi:hypothetical protein